jgi:hypothetical protein
VRTSGLTSKLWPMATIALAVITQWIFSLFLIHVEISNCIWLWTILWYDRNHSSNQEVHLH